MNTAVPGIPYVPVPPYHGTLWQWALNLYVPRFLRRTYGTTRVDVVGARKLRASIDAGHGILVTPNHPRDEDAIVLNALARAVGRPVFVLASAHAFAGGKRRAFLLRRAGAFSIHRDGMDKQAVQSAIEIVRTARRPLVIFPEGHTSRTNDRLGPMLEGAALIARQAARKRAGENRRVVVHPVAMRYAFGFDVGAAAARVLDAIEARLTWPASRELPLHERVRKVEAGLLALQELRHVGHTQDGTVAQRIDKLTDAILAPLESEWTDGHHGGHVAARVKRLRAAVLQDAGKGAPSEAERARRWRQLEDADLAEKLYHYPPDYVVDGAPVGRVMERVEWLEQGLTGRITIHGPTEVTVTVGDAIEVSPGREARGDTDPLMAAIDAQLRAMLGIPAVAVAVAAGAGAGAGAGAATTP